MFGQNRSRQSILCVLLSETDSECKCTLQATRTMCCLPQRLTASIAARTWQNTEILIDEWRKHW
jgi:hypothetical protein